MVFFSDQERSKSKLFSYKDHATPGEIVTAIREQFQRVERNSRAPNPQERTKIRREFTLQILQHIAATAGMESYEAIDRDRLPKIHHLFQAWLNQSANMELSATKDMLVDWNIPIKLKLIFLPDNIM